MIVRLPAICADSVSIRNLVGELCRGYAAVGARRKLMVRSRSTPISPSGRMN